MRIEMLRSFPGWRFVWAALLPLLLLLACAGNATAATQTTPDPDDPYEADWDGGGWGIWPFKLSTDFRVVGWDTESQPGQLLLKLEWDFRANAGIRGSVFLDTNRDGKADYALRVHWDDYNKGSQHPNVDGTDGKLVYRLQQVTKSSLDCQIHDDEYDEDDSRPWTFPQVAATLRQSDSKTVAAIPIPLTTIGTPSSFLWAAAGDSAASDAYRPWDFVPDAANGATWGEEGNETADPRGFYGEGGPRFECSTGEDTSSGLAVRMNQGVLFTILATPPPEVTVDQSPVSGRPGDTLTFTAKTKDNRPVSAYAWDLDSDGEYDDGTTQTVSKQFPSGGRRFVRVRVTDTTQQSGVGEKTVDIVDAKPTVTLEQSPALARPNKPVELTAKATDDAKVTGITWDLDNDGQFDDGTGEKVSKTFTSQGKFTVAVRVTDDGENETIAKREIEVAERAPTMKLIASKLSPNVREKITLRADIVDDGPIRDADVKWDLSYNDRGEAENFDKATGREWTTGFGVAGKWRVKARFTDDTGKVVRADVLIDIPNKPVTPREFRIRAKKTPDQPFNTDPLVINAPVVLEIGYDDDNMVGPKFAWDADGDGEFDDGNGNRIEYTFRTAGEKKVAVRFEDEFGLVSYADTVIEIRETAESGCAGRVEVDGMRAVGCFKREKDGTRFTREPMKINGLDIEPQRSTTIRIDPISGTVETGDGFVTIKAGSVVLYEGRWKMDPECDRTQKECLAFKTSVPELAKLKGLPLKGEAEVWFTPKGTRVKTNVDVFGSIGFGATVRVDLTVDDKNGLELDDLELRTPMLPLPKNLEIGQLWLKYQKNNRRWSGGGYIVLPTPQFTRLTGDFAFSEITGFERAHGEIDGLNAPIDAFGTVYLQRIAFTLEVKGVGTQNVRVRIGGGVGASFGPRVGGMDALTVDGDFLFTFGWPLGIDIEGRASVAGFDIIGGSVGARTNGTVYGEGFIGFGLPFPAKKKGVRKDGTKLKVSKFDSDADIFNPFQLVTVKGEAEAWVEPDAFNLEARIHGDVIGITLAEARGLMSSKGVAGCGKILKIAGGFGYNWQTEQVDLFGNSCDLAPWRAQRKLAPLDDNGAGRQPGARAARAQQGEVTEIDVPAGQKALMLKLDGVGGDPVVALVAPNGTRYEMPREGAVLQREDWFFARNPRADETYLGVSDPAAGRWRIELQPGSAPLADVNRAAVLPDPKVDATVRGTGRTRTIDYRIKPIPGQTVEFVEHGSDVHRTIGAATAARGTLRFVPKMGAGLSRRLSAIVKQNGLPRKTVSLGRFTAPPLPLPARPDGLVARRGTSRVALTWKPVPGAIKYQVLALNSDGKSQYVRTTRTNAVVTKIGRADGVRFQVRAVNRRAMQSRAGTLSLARYQRRAPRRALAQRPAQGVRPRFTG